MSAGDRRRLIAAVLRWVEQQLCAHHWHVTIGDDRRNRCCWCNAGTNRRRPRDERRDCNERARS